jgi:transcriptional regulator
MVEVLRAEGRSQEEIDARLETLRGMLAITEKRTKGKAERLVM